MTSHVARVRRERTELERVLADLGATPQPSQGNFVYLRCARPAWLQDSLAGLGVAVRLLGDRTDPAQAALRITCPGNATDFTRLQEALQTVLRPEALLFDMDGVLADVSGSYRACIRQTAASYGITLTAAEVAAAKRQPGSNNDWVLTRDLLAARGVAADLAAITDRFQEFYRELAPGEALIPRRELLAALAARLPLGIVTGRPRADARDFLARHDLAGFFTTLVAMEDAPGKPDPAPVQLALQELGVSRAWLVGDTINDVLAARRAGVLPLGVVPPGEDPAPYTTHLITSGAGRVLTKLDFLQEVLDS